MSKLELHAIRQRMVDGIDIMDSRGRGNPELNSMMLWPREWDALRAVLLEVVSYVDEVSK